MKNKWGVSMYHTKGKNKAKKSMDTYKICSVKVISGARIF